MINSKEKPLIQSGESIIKAIGVGGGGSNAVNHMYRLGIQGVDFYICNTDIQALSQSPIPASNRIVLGKNLTGGLGAGAKPEVGKNAALESKEDIRNLLSGNTRMVFITAGMGGGTGTGAAPIIAEVAKSLGILTIGIVTMPFQFEGKPKEKRAEDGLAELKKHCDAVLVVINNKLKDIYGKATLREAFAQADNVLATAAKAIAEIITTESDVNVDFEDVRTALSGAGTAVMGIGVAEGDSRAFKATEMALTSPLLNNTNIHGAKHVLLHVVADEETFQMDELAEITSYIQERTGEDCELIMGVKFDSTAGKKVTVTVIAAGFDGVIKDKKLEYQQKIIDLETQKKVTRHNTALPQYSEKFIPSDGDDFFDKVSSKAPTPPPAKPEKIVFSLDDFETYQEEEEKKKREDELQKRQQHLAKLKSVSQMSQEELKHHQDVPAYLRKGVQFTPTPSSNDSLASRISVGENKKLSENKFFADNVD
ncbi:MAG: cell division protein FtsZ [Cytophagales bacterium]|nr:cell division protein FtsZ [Cytophagales bacterium]MDW8384430.1 cell division protein FtsZ [Flammeovirgaceae bacterium]